VNDINLLDFFTRTVSARQRQYEAVRAIIVDNMSYSDVAGKFGYKVNSLYTIVREAKAGRLSLFSEVQIGPRRRRTNDELQNKIINLRKINNLSAIDIREKLDMNISLRTIERILADAGFSKLKRRTYQERGITAKNKIIPARSENLDFNKLEPFKVDCPVAGAYLFLPYIIESGIIDIVKKCGLPGSSVIGPVEACLSMLMLKLIGHDRLSKVDSYDQEPGLGVPAGVNILPKPTYMCTYSCRTSENMLLDFQKEILGKFMENSPELYGGQFINLDFHSIPHHGGESDMEKIWCGSKHKTMKGANTVFAQDSKSKMIIYTRADILRREEAEEIKKFVAHWKALKGDVSETLVFDCKLTKYSVLGELNEAKEKVKFITLRKRNAGLLKKTEQIPDEHWQKIKLNIPKRKYTKVSVNESKVLLSGCRKSFRQLIIKDHGRRNPTFIITNNEDLSVTEVVEVYAKRWRIENKLSELVAFFNLNALSSPLMIRIHFDILWTFIADSLYRRFARDLRRFEHHDAKTLFRKFINMPGHVVYDGNRFSVKIRKRAHTPVLKSVDKLTGPIAVPWLNGKTVEIVWTA